MATYGSASRLRFPNRDKPAAIRARVVKFVADFFVEIARGYEPARVAACGRSPGDAQPVVDLTKSISGDNRRGLRRFEDGNSIQREVLWRFVSRLTNTTARGLLLEDRRRRSMQ